MIFTVPKANRCKLDAGRLRDVFNYNSITGEFRARITTGRRRAGSVAGCLKTNGYVTISLDGKLYFAHRLAWLYIHGDWPPSLIDHIDGVTKNNAITNLRCADKSTNAQNLKQAHRGNKSGLLGVVEDKSKGGFASSICVKGKRYWLGVFPTALEAHEAYLARKRILHEACTI